MAIVSDVRFGREQNQSLWEANYVYHLFFGLVLSGILVYRLKSIGRSSFLMLQVLGIVLIGLSGYQLFSPHMYAFDGIHMMLSGAVLAVIYTTEGAILFTSRKDG